MREKICTASIFCGLVFLIYLGFHFDYPATSWWLGDMAGTPTPRIPLVFWILVNVVLPGAIIVMATSGLWAVGCGFGNLLLAARGLG